MQTLVIVTGRLLLNLAVVSCSMPPPIPLRCYGIVGKTWFTGFGRNYSGTASEFRPIGTKSLLCQAEVVQLPAVNKLGFRGDTTTSNNFL